MLYYDYTMANMYFKDDIYEWLAHFKGLHAIYELLILATDTIGPSL